MPETQDKPQRDRRIPVMMSGAEVEAIDAWRFANHVSTRSEALRRLCQRGLQQEAQADG